MTVGGAQKILLSQGRWFYEKGYRVTAAFLYDKEGLHEEWRKENPFEIINLDLWQKDGSIIWKFLKLLFGVVNFFRFLKANQFDVIESFTSDCNFIAIPLAFLAGIPIRVPTVHGLLRNRPKILSKIHSIVVNSKISSSLIVVSNRVKEEILEIEKIKEEKIRVVFNGIQVLNEQINQSEARKLLGWSEDSPVILNVGRLNIAKGQKHLIDALPNVLEIFPQARVYIAGEGELRKSLENQIIEKSLQAQIELLGTRSDIQTMLRAADIFVLPSLWEGLSIALLEAMATECPVVVSDVEGIDDVVVHGKNGLVVPIGGVEALSDVIIELLSNPVLGEQLGKAAKEHGSAYFSVDAMCEQYEEIILMDKF
jgi:glycosyltransferase involved in cell wall biosynthesis